ncbi:MAG: hypothetical protein ACLUVV_00620 [Christensenellales bacterium]
MDLMILDASFAPLGVVDAFISLQWTRRYYEVAHLSCIPIWRGMTCCDRGAMCTETMLWR